MNIENDLTNYLNKQNQLMVWPAKKKNQMDALLYLADQFELGKMYNEKEVNELLNKFHTFEDPALLRRELYEKRLLNRKHDGSEYWKADNTSMNYFITGSPGVGKSTIGKLLQEKGYKFIDVDQVLELARWYNKKSGRLVTSNKENNADWYEEHDWNWDRSVLKRLLAENDGKDVFVCGITSNQTNDLDLFDKVFLLQANTHELRKRMLERKIVGDTSDVDHVFDWQQSFESEMLKHGAIAIDAHLEPQLIVREILSLSQKRT